MKKMLMMLGLVSVLSVSAFAEKIAVVDSQEVIGKYSGTKTVGASLDKEAKRYENEINQRQVALQKEEVALQAKGNKITDAEKKAFQAKVEGFYKYVNTSKETMGKMEYDKMSVIFNKANKAVQAVAAEGKYDYVLERGAVLLGGEDITDKVIKKMEATK